MGFRRAVFQVRQPGRQTRLAALFALISACVSFTVAQASPNDKRILRAAPLKPGIVVESTSKGWGAEKAGLKKDDTIVRWSQGDAGGLIRSPLDLTLLEFERRLAAPIVVEGFRASKPHVWTLGFRQWGLKT